uniref:IQ motif containing GTPase activating protein 3 n=1 Tax=Sphaeramia orbicularis TaxID=375764 RepID=A0A673CMP7_9TELE
MCVMYFFPDERLTAEQMDEQRIQGVAYQYLCRLEEAKRWMEACLGEELPAPTELEESLRNGVILAKLAHRFAPNAVPQKKIYDLEQQRYQALGLQFRHTDNINHWRVALTTLGLPTIFHPETTDIYDKKNMPRAIYCIHALSLFLYRLGKAPQIHDLYGKVKFTEEEINNMKLELDKYGIQMPAFNKIGGILTNELSVDEAAVHAAVIAINEAVDRGHVGATAEALRNPNAMLNDLQEALMSVYQEILKQAKRQKAQQAGGRTEEKDMYEEYLTQREIQGNINTVNVRSAVEQVDEALDSADELSLLSALQLPCLALRGLRTDNGPWYLDQLAADRHQKALVQQIHTHAYAFRVLEAAVHSVNEALRRSDPRQTVSCLMNSDLQLPQVFPPAASLYHRELQLLQRQTEQVTHESVQVTLTYLRVIICSLFRYFDVLLALKQQSGRELLTWNQLQEEINCVNNSEQDEQQKVLAVSLINEAVVRADPQRLLSALLLPSTGLEGVLQENSYRYLTLLSQARQHRAQVSRDPGAELWLADIQEQVRRANQDTQKALKLCLAVAAVNQAVKENRVKQTLRVLSLPEVALQSVMADCAAEYQRALTALLREKTLKGDNKSAWVRIRLEDGSSYFFQLNRLEGSWEKPHNFIHNSVFLDRHEIQEVVRSVSGSYSRSVLWKSNETLIVHLQALSRGFLVRRQLKARRRYLITNTPAVVVIQVRHPHPPLLIYDKLFVCQIQSFVKMWLVRRRYRARLQFFRRHVSSGVATYLHSATPPLSVVRKFVHLLDLGDGDIREEAELLRLREEVVRNIRFNRQLESDLDLMDLKIGLLVRNRATVQEVVSHCKKLTKKNKEQLSDMMDVERSKGLKALSRQKRDRLEAYQHLFYLLQTQPLYLAQLIFLMPQSRSTSFMEMLVFSLFNYGSDRREAFLLLQLFTEALRYEIRLKVEQPQDIVTGNPTVIKMLVNFYRHARGHNALRETLGPALQDVLLDRSLSIRTDPVDVYKTWINQTESQTGTKSSLPYEVSPADALSHPEVQRRIDVAIINLKNLTDRVLKAITSNLHKLPYGLRYTAKVLRDALKAKFPEASEDELYKIVGNLIYYRYMNPAVVAPDGFDVVDRSAGSALQPDQRHILGSIARMLQHAAANKHFHGDGYHVRVLNQYISQTHAKFRKFLLAVCDVPEPEDRFCIDEYSELLIVNRPVVYISVSELINTHQVNEHIPYLPLHCPVFLCALGDSLSADPGSESGLAQISKMEVSLTLTNKFDIFNDSEDKPDMASHVSLSSQEACHDWLMQRRARQDARTPEKLKRNQSLVADGNLRLEEKKRKIVRSLRRLEGMGVLRPPQSENQILQMIAKDIRHQRLHRQRRGAELVKLRQTLNSLQLKSSFHSEQIDFYRHYITSCLDNLTAGKPNNKKAAESKGKKKAAVSYSATRLQEKGVLLEIQDLFKNVVFDIVPGPEKGSFSVKARFLGVEMEEFLLKYQDLLQLQYEGVAVMKMFDKAKVNVNLLIFLLNKKFYKK